MAPKITFCIFAILLGNVFVFAQTEKASPDQNLVAKVSPSLRGQSFDIIYEGLVKNPKTKPKGEFETTAAYEKRAEPRSIEITKSTTAADDIVFIYEPHLYRSKDESIVFSYDADEELATVEFSPQKSYVFNTSLLPIQAGQYKFLGTSTGSNAFGVKRRITHSSFVSRYIGILNWNEFFHRLPVKFLVSVEQARKAKDSLAVAYIFKLSRPYFAYDENFDGATIDDPRAETSYDLMLYCTVQKIILFNSVSRVIYATVTPWKGTPKVVSSIELPKRNRTESTSVTSTPSIISKGVINGNAISLPKPEYPPTAKAVGASGSVSVQVTVDEDGNVISAIATSGHPLLKQVAASAARNAKFNPTLVDGHAVKVSGIIVYNFQ